MKWVGATPTGDDLTTQAAAESEVAAALAAFNVEDLANVTITSLASGEILKWNGSAWVNSTDATGGGGGGASVLDDLTDVVVSAPATGHLLRYNGSTWVNVAGSTYFAATSHTHAIGDLTSDVATQAELDAHTGDTSTAHAASAIGFTPAGSVVATDVQAAIVEVDGDVAAHVADTVDAHDASAISTTGGGTYATGSTVQADISALDAAIAGMGGGSFLSARKTSNQTVTNSTTYVNDTEITLSITAGVVYRLHLTLFYTSVNATDLKIRWAVSAGTLSGRWGGTIMDPAGTSTLAVTSPLWKSYPITTEMIIGGSGTNDMMANAFGLVSCDSNAAITLQWAQNTVGATATTMFQHTHLILTPIS